MTNETMIEILDLFVVLTAVADLNSQQVCLK